MAGFSMYGGDIGTSPRRFSGWAMPLPFLLVGCWSERVQPDRVVWSDDDSQQLVVELLFEERGAIGDTSNKRNFRHRLLVDGDPVGDVRDGQSGAAVYLMSQRGYAVNSVLDSEGRAGFLHTDLASGTVTPLTSPSDTEIYFLPSPSGAWIAQISPAEGEVTMLDAAELSPVATAMIDGPAVDDWTWTPAEVLVVVQRGDAWSITPDGGVESVASPGCMNPKTTSSAISAAGLWIYVDADGVQQGDTVPTAAFGCQ